MQHARDKGCGACSTAAQCAGTAAWPLLGRRMRRSTPPTRPCTLSSTRSRQLRLPRSAPSTHPHPPHPPFPPCGTAPGRSGRRCGPGTPRFLFRCGWRPIVGRLGGGGGGERGGCDRGAQERPAQTRQAGWVIQRAGCMLAGQRCAGRQTGRRPGDRGRTNQAPLTWRLPATCSAHL